jgi:S1-C subfamily serine protease
MPYDCRSLGIQVKSAEGTVSSRYGFDGAEILAVLPRSPSAAAGGARRATASAGGSDTRVACGVDIFPGVAVLVSSGLDKSQELIIAVDGVRIHDVSDFGAALDKVQPGEVLYLTIIGGGRRKQIRVALLNVRRFIRGP